jgi:PHS family inorganic phosphate transporter-like MFS transporter
VLYLAIGLNWSYLRHWPFLLVFLYGMTFFFANYGPNTTTFILPSLLYSPECRSTLNGISAAAGKIGALVGATLFGPAATSLGDDHVMMICSGVAVVAFFLTYFFIPSSPTRRISHEHTP